MPMPFGIGDAPLRGTRANHDFDNLLPDSDAIRRRLATRFGVPTLEPFDLLAALPRGFPAKVEDRILEGLRRAAERLDAMPAA